MFKVIFCAQGYERRKWKNPLREAEFEYTILKSPKIRAGEEKYVFFPINLLAVLFNERPSVIITGGFSISTILVFLFHLLTETPYIIHSGEIIRKNKRISGIKTFVRKILAKNSAGFVAYGTKAGEYLHYLNPQKPIFYGWNTVDTDFFSKNVRELRKTKKEIFSKLGLSDDKTHILTVGYLIKRKGFENLIKAIKIVDERNQNFVLHIVGAGSQRKNLENLVENLGLTDKIKFWGFKQKGEIPQFFAIADFFVFPSYFDIWGLVPIEAMACGFPVIASKYAGSTYDLVKDGTNGFIIDPYNIEEMAEKIQILLNNPELREKMSKNAQKTIQKRFTLEHSARGFLEAVNILEGYK